MIKVDIVSVGDISPNLIAQLKTFARVSESTTDALLVACLRESLLKVSEYNDVSLIPCTIEVCATECDGEVRLYQTIGNVIEVTSNGTPIAYTLDGNIVKADAETVRVKYTTTVDDGNLAMYLPTVMSYATARFDGVSGVELSKILMR